MYTTCRKGRACGFIVVLLVLLWACAPLAHAQPGTLRMRLFKAGKADAFLLRTATQVVLIDTAEEDDADKILKYLRQQGIERIDTLVLTHLDKGHIGGAPDILSQVEVGRVLMPSYQKSSTAFKALQQALSRQRMAPIPLTEDDSFSADNTTFHLTVARAKHYAEDEDDGFSLVTRVTHGGHTLLFTGDIPAQRISELLEHQADWQADFLQVPAHGRHGPMTQAFLQAVRPRLAVITCSEKNPPAPEVLALLEEQGARVWLTMHGPVDIVTDGSTFTIDQ